MGMKAKVTGGDGTPREIPPPGKYLGLCNGVYMLGTQPGYQGGKPKPQVLISFELHKRKGAVRDTQGQVYETGVICSFTCNVNSKLMEIAGALLDHTFTEEDLEKIQSGGGFDAEPLIGRVCWMDLIHEKKADGSPRDKIKTVSPLDGEDDNGLADIVINNAETDHVYWDWTLGQEAPKRIKYFWDRAFENPDRESDPAKSSLPTGKFAVAQTSTDDSPF